MTSALWRCREKSSIHKIGGLYPLLELTCQTLTRTTSTVRRKRPVPKNLMRSNRTVTHGEFVDLAGSRRQPKLRRSTTHAYSSIPSTRRPEMHCTMGTHVPD